MNEGPHIDLVDWKNYVSNWESVDQTSNLSFTSKEVSSNEIPRVTKREIMDAVRKKSESWPKYEEYDETARWIELANECESPTTYPCGISVSRIRLRVSVLKDGKWTPIQMIDLALPMGCYAQPAAAADVASGVAAEPNTLGNG